MRLPALAVASLALSFLAVPAESVSYVLGPDHPLVDQAELVAEVRIRPGVALRERPTSALVYPAEILEVLKGTPPGTALSVRVPGHLDDRGSPLLLPGLPAFAPGDRAILFLLPYEDGTFGVLHLSLGVFLVEGGGPKGAAVSSPVVHGLVSAEPRHYHRFKAWIRDRAAGLHRGPDYWLRKRPAPAVASKYTLIGDAYAPTPMLWRWAEFDLGLPVVWHFDESGTGRASFQSALERWNDEPFSNVHLVEGDIVRGPFRTPVHTFQPHDGVNAVIFGDPADEMPGRFDCENGVGVLAFAVPRPAEPAGNFNGEAFRRIFEADILINQDAECFIDSRDFNAEELFAHEIGHTLGLGHSCDFVAGTPAPDCRLNRFVDRTLMRPYLGLNGGGFLRDDDRFGIWRLYRRDEPGVPCTGPTNESLCLHDGRFVVMVDWHNQFDESQGRGVALPRSDLGGFFSFGDPSNVELILKVLDFGESIQVYYGQLTNLSYRLTVVDTQTGAIRVYYNTDGNCGGFDQRAFRPLKVSPLSRRDDPAGTPTSGSCSPSATTLCLSQGRFSVEVLWRNQFDGQTGVGGAKPLSELTGAFFFTDPSNEELLVKVLDANGRIDVYWGALSNLEYSLRVTDTTTGQARTYQNAAGQYCGGLQVGQF